MDGDALLDDLRSELSTELDRLGSEKALLAATEARLEADGILITAAAVLAEARGTLADWAEARGPAAADFRAAAERLGDACDGVATELGEPVDLEGVDAPFLSLAGEGDAERAGALLAAGLVLDRLFLQSVSFFVNEAATARADRFRELRGMADDLVADGRAAIEAVAADGADGTAVRERAERAATATVEAAYDDYVRRLDAMGFDPKPIC
jgi:hypothetical protein